MVDSLGLNKHIVVLQGATNKSSTSNPVNNLVTQAETMQPLANPAPNASENSVQTANGTWKQVAQNSLMYVKALSNGTNMAVSDLNNVQEIEPKRDTLDGPRYYEYNGQKFLIADNQAVIRRKSKFSSSNADVVEIITFDSNNKQTIFTDISSIPVDQQKADIPYADIDSRSYSSKRSREVNPEVDEYHMAKQRLQFLQNSNPTEMPTVPLGQLKNLSDITTASGLTLANINSNLGTQDKNYKKEIFSDTVYIEALNNQGQTIVKEIHNLRANRDMQNLYIDKEGTEYYLSDYINQKKEGIGTTPDKPIPIRQINSAPAHSLALFDDSTILMPAPDKDIAKAEKTLQEQGYKVIGISGSGFFDAKPGSTYGTPIGYRYTNIGGIQKEEKNDFKTKVGTYTDENGNTKLLDLRGKSESEIGITIEKLKEDGASSIHLFSGDAYKVKKPSIQNRDKFSVPRSMLVFDKDGNPLGHVITQNLRYHNAHELIQETFGDKADTWVRLDGDLYARRYIRGTGENDLRSNAGSLSNNVNPVLIVRKEKEVLSPEVETPTLDSVQGTLDPSLAKQEKITNAEKDLNTRKPEEVDGIEKKIVVWLSQIPFIGQKISSELAKYAA